jgi:catechol 2,3-dioxygenase-like lactoylglutathione lyase family enzyme
MGAHAVLYVKTLDSMLAFYTVGLGLQARAVEERHATLSSEHWTLSLVVAGEEFSAAITIESPPRRRENVPVKLAFEVDSISRARSLLAELGGCADPAATEWDFDGFRRCDALDPEGNVITLLAELSR